ncbi:ATPase/protein kinase [Bacillus sp. FJAT-27225]|uniref:methylmalonyl Co-A mutase-associated GTPase MeaB n=1 Tax=Bacillus sp. FJAT-27225 TaxID=1743144 RepID=UPI00080C31E6|nr:methylmalonyl Co-A mutase-associated GTPase MeaB [Bacillus sp. FJAT-27225]OCA91027.1 ATPase/protein kinase [Bacillus sp. FJAT-27225]
MDRQAINDGKEKKGRPIFKKKRSQEVQVNDLVNTIPKGSRSALARGITLIESNASRHFGDAQVLLQKLLPYTGNSIRIGITGVPGAGKSTFIETFGLYLCEIGYKVAVLAIDPSSSVNGGSILGDKTRMEQLSRHPSAFIRPSPTAGKLGGVHRKTRESMLLCEAAGYDVILVETVGVGQSEVSVRDMVDFFMLLVLTGAGDELQGMKKGIMELADGIVVNKADGENLKLAEKTAHEYRRILHFLQPATIGWETKAYACSALTKKGIPEMWESIKEFERKGKQSGIWEERRRIQLRGWFHTVISNQLHYDFYQNEKVKGLLPRLESEILEGSTTPAKAADMLLGEFYKSGE